MGIEKLEKLLRYKNYFRGFSIKEINDAEKRLGVKLPYTLKNTYLKFGRNSFINGHNHLIPPKYLMINDNFLPFYQENQCCYLWGVKVDEMQNKQIDIYGKDDEGKLTYIDEFTEDFLMKECIFRYPQYLFQYQIISKEGHLSDIALEKYFGSNKSLDRPNTDFSNIWYWKENLHEIACIIREGKKRTLRIFTQSQQGIFKIISKLGIEKWELNCYEMLFKPEIKPLSSIHYGEDNLEEFKIDNKLDGSSILEDDNFDLPF